MRSNRESHKKRALQIHAQLFVPHPLRLRKRDVGGHASGITGIVDEHIDFPEPLHGGTHRRFDLVTLTYIRTLANAVGSDGSRSDRKRALVAPQNDDLITVVRKRLRYRLSNAATSACYYDDAVHDFLDGPAYGTGETNNGSFCQ